MNNVVDSAKYYVRLDDRPVAVVKVMKTEDGKYHRYIGLIKQKPTTKEVEKTVKLYNGETKTFKKFINVSPKKLTSEYVDESSKAWIDNGFKSDIPADFPTHIMIALKELFAYNYGHTRLIDKFIPRRYEQEVTLFPHEFRTFNKPAK